MQYPGHNENIALYEKLIAESELDPSRDEARHNMLLTLLADALAKALRPPDSQALAEMFAEMLLVAELDDRSDRLPRA
jgi:hypothetical protein